MAYPAPESVHHPRLGESTKAILATRDLFKKPLELLGFKPMK
jgi:hypothetical protein